MTPTAFAAALCARGIELTLRGSRLHVWPVRAYRDGLSLDEREYIRAHRDALKALVRAGLPETTVQWSPGPTTPTKAEPDLRCPFCYHVPCIGAAHPAFRTLHALDPQEQQRRHVEQRERDTKEWEMRRRFRLPSPTWE